MPRLLLLTLCSLLVGCAAPLSLPAVSADWATDSQAYRGQEGQRVACQCPPNPAQTNLGAVWGAEVYTDDSAVCVAAVHAGKISFDRGGRVVLEVRPGQGAYRGTDWNGVISQPYGAWTGSFLFR